MSYKAGNIPWNKGMKGFIHKGSFKANHLPWNKNKKCLNISKGIKRGYENGRITWNKNRKCPEISKSMEGKIPFNKGRSYEKIYGIEGAKKEREKRAVNRDKHWNWKGGKSCEPYPLEFNKKVKNQIKERDNYECQSPGSCKGHLTIHHIDYNKGNNKYGNLITLCVRHNAMANKNKEYWEKFYHSILSKKYGYNY